METTNHIGERLIRGLPPNEDDDKEIGERHSSEVGTSKALSMITQHAQKREREPHRKR
ncbi:MAG: hypothetical protein Q9177_004226 [Variospora cf. flavescens]